MISSSDDLEYHLTPKGWNFKSNSSKALYQQWHLDMMLPYIRVCLVISMALWPFGVLTAYITIPTLLPILIPVFFFIIFPLALFIFYATYKQALVNLIAPLMIVGFGIAEILLIWIFEDVTLISGAANQIIIITSFFAFALTRLPSWAAALSVLPGISYVLFYHIIKFTTEQIDFVTFSIYSFMPFSTVFVGSMFILIQERFFMDAFVSEKTVEYQHQSLKEEKAHLSRFLAPEVTDMVREKGLEFALGIKTIELSVVYCDLRGFTNYTEKNGADKMASLLHDYYEIVVDVAKSYGATVKDLAGDGILMLVGAPIERKDHKTAAIKLARSLVQEVHKLTKMNLIFSAILSDYRGPSLSGVQG